MDFQKTEVRSTIRFFALQGESATEIFEKLHKVYGDSTPSYSTVSRWVTEFKCGRKNVEDEPRPGRPISATDEFTCSKVQEFVMQDRRVTINQIAEEMGISRGSVGFILHEKLRLSKLSSRWVPRLLTLAQKEERVRCCRNLLNLCQLDPVNFHTKIVTGDETWIHHYDPETKQQSMQWLTTGQSGPIKAKATKSAGKVMATIVWDANGVLHTDYISKGSTMNANHYVKVLEELRYNIRNKRRGSLQGGLFLLHDNASSHTAKIVKAALDRSAFWKIDHPPYSPDLAPCDYYLFPHMKKIIRGRRFESDNELISCVHSMLNSFTKEFFSEGMKKLIQRAKRCIELGGDYVEKPQNELE